MGGAGGWRKAEAYGLIYLTYTSLPLADYQHKLYTQQLSTLIVLDSQHIADFDILLRCAPLLLGMATDRATDKKEKLEGQSATVIFSQARCYENLTNFWTAQVKSADMVMGASLSIAIRE